MKKLKKPSKKKLIAGGVAMLVTGLVGVSVPPEILLSIWGALPWS